ncbi:MAG TPA: hypothetical protein VGD59_10580 [Acidisarcina sp.]
MNGTLAGSVCAIVPLTLACLIGLGCKSSQPAATNQPAPAAAPAQAATATTTAPDQYPPSTQSTAPVQQQTGTSQYPQQGAPTGQQQTGAGYPERSQSGNYPPAQSEPRALVIPAGTALRVRLDQTLSSRQNQPGDSFSATVEAPVIVRGETIIKRGSTASGTVVDAKALGRIKGGAVLEIRLDRVRAGGRSYEVATSTVERVEKGKGKRSAEFAGGGAGVGALIGGLAGGGKGALIGALAGGGAGTAGGALTGNHDLVLPAETLLTFRTTHDVRLQ